MHIHILGICGTFMGGLAVLARQLGHDVTGSDENVYPPMSTQLQEQGIELLSGYSAENLQSKPNCVVIGNALSRGNVEVEAVLNLGLPYTSGAQWLAEHVLQQRWVIGVAGTHGKTTTSSMVAWILEAEGLNPGFLIGGIPQNFGQSARLGKSSYFVIEADEYDTAFFDKRSKFIHYRPKTAILNNLEYDHADIFPDLNAIKTQFHHLVRTIPGCGMIIAPAVDEHIQSVLSMGCWTPLASTSLTPEQSTQWQSCVLSEDASCFNIQHNGQRVGTVNWSLTGLHNVSNALSAIAASYHAGIDAQAAVQALCDFQSVKRRMGVKAKINGITLYDDFAHHPTAIASTLHGLRGQVGRERIIAILELRSNTMKMGIHKDTMADALLDADHIIICEPDDLSWNLKETLSPLSNVTLCQSLDAIIDLLMTLSQPGDHLVFMSNGGFGGIHGRVETALQQR